VWAHLWSLGAWSVGELVLDLVMVETEALARKSLLLQHWALMYLALLPSTLLSKAFTPIINAQERRKDGSERWMKVWIGFCMSPMVLC